MPIGYEWRGGFTNPELDARHGEGFGRGRRGIGARRIARAVHEARAAGCEWLHVDFDDHLRGFHFEACGFQLTPAGVIAR
jgi:hypothetical protein